MYGSLQELCELEEKSGKPFWKIVQEDDCREQGITEEVSFEQMRAMYQAMKDADARYDEKLKSESGLVGTEGKKMMRRGQRELCSVEILSGKSWRRH